MCAYIVQKGKKKVRHSICHKITCLRLLLPQPLSTISEFIAQVNGHFPPELTTIRNERIDSVFVI